MNTIEQNNEQAYFLLEKANMLFEDFNIDQVVSFDLNEDFYIVAYDSLTRDFITMKATGYRHDKDALAGLLDLVEDNKEGFLPASIVDAVVNIVENKILSGENSRFFDAH